MDLMPASWLPFCPVPAEISLVCTVGMEHGPQIDQCILFLIDPIDYTFPFRSRNRLNMRLPSRPGCAVRACPVCAVYGDVSTSWRRQRRS